MRQLESRTSWYAQVYVHHVKRIFPKSLLHIYEIILLHICFYGVGVFFYVLHGLLTLRVPANIEHYTQADVVIKST